MHMRRETSRIALSIVLWVTLGFCKDTIDKTTMSLYHIASLATPTGQRLSSWDVRENVLACRALPNWVGFLISNKCPFIFQHPSETPPPTRVETREERLERRRRERAEQTAYKLEQEIALWDPTTNPKATMDPFKTLFVARIVSKLL